MLFKIANSDLIWVAHSGTGMCPIRSGSFFSAESSVRMNPMLHSVTICLWPRIEAVASRRGLKLLPPGVKMRKQIPSTGLCRSKNLRGVHPEISKTILIVVRTILVVSRFLESSPGVHGGNQWRFLQAVTVSGGAAMMCVVSHGD